MRLLTFNNHIFFKYNQLPNLSLDFDFSAHYPPRHVEERSQHYKRMDDDARPEHGVDGPVPG